MVRSTLLSQLSLLLALLHAVTSTSVDGPQHIFSSAPDADPRTFFPPLAAPPQQPTSGRTRRVAIIGAGPTGTSSSYFLHQAQLHLSSSFNSSDTLDITLYERSQIGGRTAITYPYSDATQDPVELGASIFADVNLNLRRAIRDFKLDTGAANGMGGQMGIWDGQQFLFEGDQGSWWTSAKFFLRYGYSAVTTQSIVTKQLAYFSALYRPAFLHTRDRRGDDESKGSISGYPWKKVEDLAEAVNASGLAATTGMQFFKDRRVSELFIEEMVEAATRVNYAQDTDRIHGFGALVSLAASGADGVKSGNYRIFEEFVRRSGARILTGVEGHVTGLVKFDSVSRPGKERKTQWYVGTKSGEGEVYDAVIIATPWHNADITLLNTPQRVRGKPFVRLHVTLLTTRRASPRPEYFGLGAQDVVPRTILTSSESVRRASSDKKQPEPPASGEEVTGNKVKNPKLEFFSLNYLRSVNPPSSTSSSSEKEWVVKIFSPQPLPSSLLDDLFGESTISWIHRHTWNSYPYLTPTTRFPHIHVDEGLYYPNAMESLVSTMETSTVAAKNAVGLLLKEWYGDEFVNGKDCKWGVEDWTRDPMKNVNWAGWGCDSG